MDHKIRAVIIDDEPLARRTIRSLLLSFPEIEVAGECGDGASAVPAIRSLSPDLLFLDVQMPGMNGFEVLHAAAAEQPPAVIFVTAYDRYALRAFEVHAMDYLLKPFDDERFGKAVIRVLEQIHENRRNALGQKLLALLGDYTGSNNESSRHGIDRIAVRSHGRISFVSIHDIDWVEAADQYVLLHVQQESHLIRESMNQMEAQLPADQFFRIHRSSLVNLNRVRELRSNRQGESHLLLQNGIELKVSRNRRVALQEVLMGR